MGTIDRSGTDHDVGPRDGRLTPFHPGDVERFQRNPPLGVLCELLEGLGLLPAVDEHDMPADPGLEGLRDLADRRRGDDVVEGVEVVTWVRRTQQLAPRRRVERHVGSDGSEVLPGEDPVARSGCLGLGGHDDVTGTHLGERLLGVPHLLLEPRILDEFIDDGIAYDQLRDDDIDGFFGELGVLGDPIDLCELLRGRRRQPHFLGVGAVETREAEVGIRRIEL